MTYAAWSHHRPQACSLQRSAEWWAGSSQCAPNVRITMALGSRCGQQISPLWTQEGPLSGSNARLQFQSNLSASERKSTLMNSHQFPKGKRTEGQLWVYFIMVKRRYMSLLRRRCQGRLLGIWMRGRKQLKGSAPGQPWPCNPRC